MAARRAVPAEVRAFRDATLTARAVSLVSRGPVCAYLPVGTEPGGPALVDALAAQVEVLLPVVPTEPGPLDWARFDGGLAAGPCGLREPTGRRLGPSAIARAALVLVPALAADRAGGRLGRGGGHYDRTLPLADPATPLVAVLDDDELVDWLPTDAHDWPVTAALLPEAGLVTLGNIG